MKYKNQIKRKLTVAPATSVISVADAKARLAIETTEDDALIQVMINSATDFCDCLLYTSPSPRDRTRSRMPSSA